MASAKENEKIAREFLAALGSSDFDKVRQFLTEESVWESTTTTLPANPVYKGEAIIRDLFAPVRAWFENSGPAILVDLVVADDKHVMCETRGVGKFLNGRTYDNRYAWRLTIKDGKVVVIREYMDSAYALKQLEG